MAEHLFDAIQAELLALCVESLGESVGIEEERAVHGQLALLFLECEVGEHADGQVRLHGQLADGDTSGVFGEDQRCFVAGVAEAQSSRRQVEDSDKERHEHIALVVVAELLVDGLHDVGRVAGVGGGDAEQLLHDRHHDGRRHTLSRDVADAEEQLLVADVEIEEVATHFLRGYQ